MTAQKQEKYSGMIFWFSFGAAALSFAALLVLIGLEAQIRWSLNQNFSFFPGFALEALIFSVFALVLGLAYIYRAVDPE